MTLEEEGAYIRLLSYCWREGSIPADNAMLSRLCKGASNECLTRVRLCFEQHRTDVHRLVHKRLDAERQKQQEYADAKAKAGVESGKSRRQKKFSTEQVFDSVGVSVRTEREHNRTLQSSSSSSNIEPPIVPQGGPVAVPDSKPKKPKATMTAEQREWFWPWWESYPRKEAKQPAEIAWGRIVRDKATADAALVGLKAQLPDLLARERDKIPHPATWINQRRWTDEIRAPTAYPVRDVPPNLKPANEVFLR
jgi:uncharacterized protein YdaU (DUF1376 family)